MFSVVIPLYNKQLSIKKTIESVLAQSFQDFEIIIINDGSTDNSVDIVKAINDSRVRLIEQENLGVSAARNRGIKESKSDWITFLDADDLWVPEHLEEFKKMIDNFPHTNWLFSGFTINSQKKTTKRVFNKSGKLNNIFNDLLDGIRIHTSTVCIRRSLFKNHNELYFRTGLNNSEDREVWYKLACIDKSPIYIAKSLSIYDTASDSNSLTKQNFNEHFLSMEYRISRFTRLITVEDKNKLHKYIRKFNRNALIAAYTSGHFKKSHKVHLNILEYNLLKYTMNIPHIFKRYIAQVLRFL